MRRKTKLLLAVATVGVGLSGAGTVAADPGRSAKGEADLNPTPAAATIYDPATIDGEAKLRTRANGAATTIRVEAEGLRPGTSHVAHVHLGDCAALQPGLIVHGLEPLVADEKGRARSTTVVDDSLAGLEDCEWWVAVHEGPQDTDPQSPAVAVGPVLLES